MVLDLLAQGDRPLTVRELEHRSDNMGWRLSRMQLHRVLARLVRRETAKRVELLSAYIPNSADADCLLVCSGCGAVRKLALPELRARISALCRRERFAPSRLICEAPVHCARCIDRMAV
jgi:Fe2+ or Zn2+ uptake regulation protein